MDGRTAALVYFGLEKLAAGPLIRKNLPLKSLMEIDASGMYMPKDFYHGLRTQAPSLKLPHRTKQDTILLPSARAFQARQKNVFGRIFSSEEARFQLPMIRRHELAHWLRDRRNPNRSYGLFDSIADEFQANMAENKVLRNMHRKGQLSTLGLIGRTVKNIATTPRNIYDSLDGWAGIRSFMK